ncbi:MAG TPA: hypothetical protein VI114_13460, partial [Chthoniobacterales bacterium]
MSLRHICGLKGQESPGFSQGFSLGNISIDERPHKALPSSALLEKHPVRRVGGAEGAAEKLWSAMLCDAGAPSGAPTS